MLPKVKIQNPLKFYNLYQDNNLIYIGECKTLEEFTEDVKETLGIDLYNVDPKQWKIETRETEIAENQGWE